ncbi:MAG: dihydrofolate reductase [Bdellovibrionales bacterium]
MIISHIVATDLNGAIGKDNKLPWHLPEDLKFFKATTQGKIMIMGRKTFDSIGRLLPGRFHIVITRQSLNSENPMLKYVSSLDEALKMAKSLIGQWPEEVFILGGGEIFTQSIDLVDRIYLTKIEKVVEGDCFYPKVDFSKFNIDKEDHFHTSEKFSIRTYCRKDHQ